LINAAIDGLNSMVEMLLHLGAQINAQDKHGMCALHVAAQECNSELITLLLNSGAIVDIEDAHGNTPLGNAVYYCGGKGRGDVIEALLKAGADPRYSNRHGQTPIGLAELMGDKVLHFFHSAEG